MRVLIADDSPLVVDRVTALLSEVGGIEIVGQSGTAPTTAEAIRCLSPDVVILDIRMPGGSGIDVLEGIVREHLKTTAIVLTNHGTAQYRKKCLESGARFFLDKSTDFEKLTDALRALSGISAG
jgi:DNA-binding NarL/FixJ family response regulator